ncbi:MAG: hypothetical protein JSV08_05650 [Acidobacteriota bacterium]|nr:MAG: hypothetical protein JSV08_05650 [Acidobacteriota bacterium]
MPFFEETRDFLDKPGNMRYSVLLWTCSPLGPTIIFGAGIARAGGVRSDAGLATLERNPTRLEEGGFFI